MVADAVLILLQQLRCRRHSSHMNTGLPSSSNNPLNDALLRLSDHLVLLNAWAHLAKMLLQQWMVAFLKQQHRCVMQYC
jgi:hypothetical protein